MSIVEIAQRTGISKSTVSRVLNNGSVSQDKRFLIEQAIKDMGYRVPKVRRGPKKKIKHSKIIIGLLFLDDDFRLLQNPETYYPQLFNSFMENHREGESEIEISPASLTPSTLNNGNIDNYNGFIIFGRVPEGGTIPEPVEEMLKKLPAVYIQDSYVAETPSTPLENIDRVYFENQIVGCIAAKYLIGKGYKRIAFINPYYRHPINDVRMTSFSFTASYHDLTPSFYIQQEPRKGPPTYSDVERLVQQMIQDGPLPEGLFVVTDIRAVHVYNALLSRGIKPMKDIDIISCDNSPFFTEQMNPKPAEIDTNIVKVGSTAIELLKQRIKNGKEEPKTILIRPELVI